MIQLTDRNVSPRMKQAFDALKDKLGKIDATLADREVSAHEIYELLQEFKIVLRVHFFPEDEEGFCQSVTAQVPRLRDRAGELCAEHREMLHKAAELCQFAVAGSPSMPWWRELSSRCRDFNQQLMRHENAEGSLLQRACQQGFKTRPV